MKTLITSLLALLCISLAQAADLSREVLQGRWLITAVDDEPEATKNHWEFAGDKFRQIEEGKQKSEEAFTIKDGRIDLGYMNIRVSEIDGAGMKATFAGFKYSLKKQ